MEEPTLNQAQVQSLKEAQERGLAFEEMVRSKGFGFIKAYYENKVKAFANALLTSDKDIKEFENERQELVGLRKLFGLIESDRKTLKDDRPAGTAK